MPQTSSTKNRIVVIGSANMDLTAHLERLPRRGETASVEKFHTSLGGKGANQAVAAARLGAQVTFVTALGQDAYGQQALAAYQSEGIDISFCVQLPQVATGVALIMVDLNGENMITVALGANSLLTPAHIQAAEPAIRDASSLLIQLETPLETVTAAVAIANQHHVPVILNPAPACPLPASILQGVTTLTPNESEALALADNQTSDPLEAATLIRQKFFGPNLIVTLGKRGALVYGNQPQIIPALPVQAVDTTGAGDAFNGALAVALGRGDAIEQATRFANRVAALSVTRRGAQSSLPTLAEVMGMATAQ